MNKEFIPYPEALELKQLGFDEPCFTYYKNDQPSDVLELVKNSEIQNVNNEPDDYISAPTYSQAFRWFREKYDLYCYVEPYEDNQFDYVVVSDLFGQEDCDGELLNTYEEAEKECLIKLIEIVKEHGQKQNTSSTT
jgi:hypothetical protein